MKGIREQSRGPKSKKKKTILLFLSQTLPTLSAQRHVPLPYLFFLNFIFLSSVCVCVCVGVHVCMLVPWQAKGVGHPWSWSYR